MSFFDFFHKPNINDGVSAFRENPNAVLLDVRTNEEYADGHIEGSKNLPLQEIESVASVITDKTTPLFVYCRSGARSARAVAILKNKGYTDVTDIGGILSYKGEVVGGRVCKRVN